MSLWSDGVGDLVFRDIIMRRWMEGRKVGERWGEFGGDKEIK